MRQKKVKQLRRELRKMGYTEPTQHNVQKRTKQVLVSTPGGMEIKDSVTFVKTLKEDCLKFAMNRAKYRYNQLTFKRGKGVPKVIN